MKKVQRAEAVSGKGPYQGHHHVVRILQIRKSGRRNENRTDPIARTLLWLLTFVTLSVLLVVEFLGQLIYLALDRYSLPAYAVQRLVLHQLCLSPHRWKLESKKKEKNRRCAHTYLFLSSIYTAPSASCSRSPLCPCRGRSKTLQSPPRSPRTRGSHRQEPSRTRWST
jgi:hypothetical protein